MTPEAPGAAPAHAHFPAPVRNARPWVRGLGSPSWAVISVVWHFFCEVKSAPGGFLPSDYCGGFNRFIWNILKYPTKISSVEGTH